MPRLLLFPRTSQKRPAVPLEAASTSDGLVTAREESETLPVTERGSWRSAVTGHGGADGRLHAPTYVDDTGSEQRDRAAMRRISRGARPRVHESGRLNKRFAPGLGRSLGLASPAPQLQGIRRREGGYDDRSGQR